MKFRVYLVLRGGSYRSVIFQDNSDRYWVEPEDRSGLDGFRIVVKRRKQ